MSRYLSFKVEIKEDVVLSSAYNRGHQGGLHFIPGSQFLGILANQVYSLDAYKDLLWSLFHSGQVQFGDARLWTPSVNPYAYQSALQLPLSYHVHKTTDDLKSVNQEHAVLLNFARLTPAQRREEDQTKLFQSQITPQGTFPKFKQSYVLKSSIDFQHQKAQEGMLFGYTTLKAGLSFMFQVRIQTPKKGQDGADEERLAQVVLNHLQGEHSVGRSRSAEFGLVEIHELDDSHEPSQTHHLFIVDHPSQSTEAHYQQAPNEQRWANSYLLLSETCFTDPNTAMPTLVPKPENFGLNSADGFRLNATYTFTRSTRWTPYNGYRKRPDTERLALVAGSVITFDAPKSAWDALDLAQHHAFLNQGIGHWNAEGLGWVVASHSLLNQVKLTSTDQADFFTENGQYLPQEQNDTSSDQATALRPDDRLGQWLTRQLGQFDFETEALKLSKRLYRDHFDPFTSKVKALARHPSQTQWRTVEQEAYRWRDEYNAARSLKECLIGPLDSNHPSLEGKDPLLIRGVAKQRWRVLELNTKGEQKMLDENNKVETLREAKRSAGVAIQLLFHPQGYLRWDEYQEMIHVLCRHKGYNPERMDDPQMRALMNHLLPTILAYIARTAVQKLRKLSPKGDAS